MRTLVLFCLMVFNLCLLCPAQDIGDCGFQGAARAREIPHFERTAIQKQVPTYPSSAIAAKSCGAVVIQIWVDREGKVVAACPLPSVKKEIVDPLLVEAARSAALEWKFAPNFGFSEGATPTFDYVRTALKFRFQFRKKTVDVR